LKVKFCFTKRSLLWSFSRNWRIHCPNNCWFARICSKWNLPGFVPSVGATAPLLPDSYSYVRVWEGPKDYVSPI